MKQFREQFYINNQIDTRLVEDNIEPNEIYHLRVQVNIYFS